MGRLSHLGSKRNSDVLLVVQDGAPAWKTSPASGVMLSVRYQAHCSASQWYAVSRLSSLEELESRSATHLRTNWRRNSRNERLWNGRLRRKAAARVFLIFEPTPFVSCGAFDVSMSNIFISKASNSRTQVP